MPDSPRPFDRTVFFVSDGTGITAETLGHSVLTQFGDLRYRPQRLPFIDSADKAREAAVRINEAGAARRQARHRVLDAGEPDVSPRSCAAPPQAFVIEMFETFVEPLERELGLKSTHTIGRSHNIAVNSRGLQEPHRGDQLRAGARRRPVGQGTGDADVILVGVSRSRQDADAACTSRCSTA